MIKLYKRMDDGGLGYHEAWASNGEVTEHWGIAGTVGESRAHRMQSGDEEREVERVLEAARRVGYQEIDPDDQRTLLVEYRVEGMGTVDDHDKRVRLEAHLDEALGWTGLGHCDGGSIGSGTMEACCFVVDFALAKAVVEDSLRGTEFGDYERIHDEGSDSG